MTATWEFTLPNGEKMFITLQWKYVPFIEELRAWVLENWQVEPDLGVSWESITTWGDLERDIKRMERENMDKFYAYADELVESVSRPKHPMAWVLDKVNEHLNSPDDDEEAEY